MNIKNSSLTTLVALVLSLGFAQEVACKGKPATVMQNVELAAAIADLPVAVLANNAEKNNTRSSHILKIVDDILVIAGQGVSVYNKTHADVLYKDYLHYKALEILFRTADIAKHAKVLATKGAPVVAPADDVTDVEVTEMRKKLIVSATALRNIIAPVAQAVARGYVALNNEDTKEASKKRLMVESLAFLTNRLSDYIAAPKGSLESDAQLVATMASAVMLLVDCKREIKTIVLSADRRAIREATTVKTFNTKKENGKTVKRSVRARNKVARFEAGK